MSHGVGKTKKKKSMMKKIKDNPDGTAEYQQVEVGVDEAGNITEGIEKLLPTLETIDGKSNGVDTEEIKETGVRLPEDMSYLPKVDGELLRKDSLKRKQGRQLTPEEVLTIKLVKKNDDIASQIKHQADLHNEMAGLHTQIAALAKENAQFKIQIIQKDIIEKLTEYGMVPGQPLKHTKDGSIYFLDGQEPESLLTWFDTVQNPPTQIEENFEIKTE